MEQVGKILGKALQRLDRPEAALAWLSSAWPSIVGESVAIHAQPLGCHTGCLELGIDSAAWEHHLQSMKRDLCSRINQAWGTTLVRDVKFVTSKSSANRPPHEFDNAHIPFIRRSQKRPS